MVDEAKGERVTAEKKLADATGKVDNNYDHNFYGMKNGILVD